MLREIYMQIKQLANTVPGVQDVTWYNQQYEGVIHVEPGVFIEFPDPIVPDPVSKTNKMAPLRIRVHVFSSILSEADGSVPDGQVEDHDNLAENVLNVLDGITLVKDEKELKVLKMISWQHYHKWSGWMVTFIEFETRMPV